jgi:hypothetical protein
MTNIVSFPKSKTEEVQLRALQLEGDRIAEQARSLNLLISDWENRFLEVGESYLSKGGDDPTLVKLIVTLKLSKELLGIFV